MQHRHIKTEFRRSCRGAKECNRMGGNSMRANPLLLSLVAGETARRRSFSDSYWSLVWYQKAEWSQRKFGTTSARHDRNLLVFISRSSLSGFVQQGSRVSRKGSELSMRMLRLSTIGCSSHPQRIINEESHVGTALRPKASSSVMLPRRDMRQWPLSCFIKRELNTWTTPLMCLENTSIKKFVWGSWSSNSKLVVAERRPWCNKNSL